MLRIGVAMTVIMSMTTLGNLVAGTIDAQTAPTQLATVPTADLAKQQKSLNILSDDDIARYRDIFRYQEDGSWKRADQFWKIKL